MSLPGHPTRRALLAAPWLPAAAPLLPCAARAETSPPVTFNPSGPRLDRSRLNGTFAEEFETFSRAEDRSARWRTVLGYGGPRAIDNRTFRSSRQQQVFVSREALGSTGDTPLGIEPFRLDRGVLSIEAQRMPPEAAARLWNYPFTSGLITSIFSFSQLYGHFEARMRLPAGKGFWPAFWLLPANNTWPPEIDVLEALGHDTRTIYVSWHSRHEGRHVSRTQAVRGLPDTSAGFHTYGLTWGRSELIWYFDDVEIWRQPTPADMHSPMFLLANLSVGGDWPGQPDAGTRFPAALQVDRIAAYSERTGS